MFGSKLALSVGLALPLFGAPCVQQTLEDYRNLAGGCEIGDKRFSDFDFFSLNPISVDASEIVITPILGPNIGLRFTGPFISTGLLDAITDTSLNFTVSTVSGLPTINGLNLTMDAETTGTGSISLDEIAVDGLNIYPLNTQLNPLFDVPTDHADVTPTNSLDINKDIFVSGLVLGTAQIFSFEQTFTQVPEPASWLLMGSALLGVGLYRRRRSSLLAQK